MTRTPYLYHRNCEIRPGMEIPDGLQRIALLVEYNGAPYQGFQKQATARITVQQELEAALSKIAGANITVICAGRTDAGVHASAQVVHFDTPVDRPEKAWLLGTNTELPAAIRVIACRKMPWHFHARFSATARTYRYLLYSSLVRPALMADQVGWVRYALDVDAMADGAKLLVGEHDFTAFRAKHCQAKNPVRDVNHLHLTTAGQLIVLEIKANAFLHHMVRNIVGSLIEIGRGAKDRQWLAEVLASRDRGQAGSTASPAGLYFVAVDYPDEFNLPTPPLGPWFLPSDVLG